MGGFQGKGHLVIMNNRKAFKQESVHITFEFQKNSLETKQTGSEDRDLWPEMVRARARGSAGTGTRDGWTGERPRGGTDRR